MDIARTLTTVDKLLIEFNNKTQRVCEIHEKLKASPVTLVEEVDSITSKVDKHVGLLERSRHFCGLSRPEQKKYLKKYKTGGDTDAHKKK